MLFAATEPKRVYKYYFIIMIESDSNFKMIFCFIACGNGGQRMKLKFVTASNISTREHILVRAFIQKNTSAEFLLQINLNSAINMSILIFLII